MELPIRTVSRENKRGNTVAGKDVKGIQGVFDILICVPIPDGVQEEAYGDEVVVILTSTMNSEVPMSVLAVEMQEVGLMASQPMTWTFT